jgi:hypothetical protein
VFPEAPPAASAPTCDTAGVIMPIISVVAAVQVTEALKLLTGQPENLHKSLMQFDVWRNEWRRIGRDRDRLGALRKEGRQQDGGLRSVRRIEPAMLPRHFGCEIGDGRAVIGRVPQRSPEHRDARVTDEGLRIHGLDVRRERIVNGSPGGLVERSSVRPL